MVRVYAGGRKQTPWARTRQFKRGLTRDQCRPRDDELHDIGGLSSLDDLGAIHVEIIVREVDANIDKFHGCGSI